MGNTIPAELPAAIEIMILKINNLAAASGDVIQLMEAVPGLANVSRYGNVRKTDAALVLGIVQTLITRICISLPSACTAIDEDAAQQMLEFFFKLNDAINLLQDESITTEWQSALGLIAANKNASPVIAGYATRLLTDYKILHGESLVKTFGLAMSSATEPAVAASWIEGFLKGSGTILLIDNDLWNIVNNWIEQLTEDVFIQVLPLLRRTFSGFSQPEKRKLGEKVKSGESKPVMQVVENNFNRQQALKGIPVVLQILGLATNTNETNNE